MFDGFLDVVLSSQIKDTSVGVFHLTPCSTNSHVVFRDNRYFVSRQD